MIFIYLCNRLGFLTGGVALLFVLLSLSSCGSKNSSQGSGGYFKYLSSNKVGYNPDYYRVPGMVYIPTGSMLIGANDDGVFGNFFAMKNRQVTINGFWMDETEVTNLMYRGFVRYTHDSVIAESLKLYRKSRVLSKRSRKKKSGKTIRTSAVRGRKPVAANINQANQAAVTAVNSGATATSAPQVDSFLDYKAVPAALQDVNNLAKLREAGLYYYDLIRKKYSPRYDNIKYKYYAFSLSAFANKNKEFTEKALAANYELKEIVVIPDTTVWVKDLSYSYNEPMSMRYYSATNYSNYPVVGVNWDQAKAFCDWRSFATMNAIQSNPKTAKLIFDAQFRLPTESEWEYAARGGRSSSLYPWGGPYTTNKLGCFLANFKNQRGVYMEDGYSYTCDVRGYWPNDFGLYNMAGNVAEWTESIYSEDAYVYVSDINPSLSNVDLKNNGKLTDKEKREMSSKKVIKGGSWKDAAAFIQNGYRATENFDQARSYIGFRTVIDLPPTSF